MADKRVNANELVTNKELEMTIRKLVIYGDNKRSIRFTKSFGKPAQNKYSLLIGPITIIKSQIHTNKKAIIPTEQ